MAKQDIEKENLLQECFQPFLFSQSKDSLCREPVLKQNQMVGLKIAQDENRTNTYYQQTYHIFIESGHIFLLITKTYTLYLYLYSQNKRQNRTLPLGCDLPSSLNVPLMFSFLFFTTT